MSSDTRESGSNGNPLDALADASRAELAGILSDNRHDKGYIARQLGHWREKWHVNVDTALIGAMTARFRASAEALRALNDVQRAAHETSHLGATLQREDTASDRADQIAREEHALKIQELTRKKALDEKFKQRDEALLDAEISAAKSSATPPPADAARDPVHAIINRWWRKSEDLLRQGHNAAAVKEYIETVAAADIKLREQVGDHETAALLGHECEKLLGDLGSREQRT